MMFDSVQQLHELLDQQQGIQDGISLAYNIGQKDITLQQALEASAHKNEFYCRGLVEGFRTIMPQESTDVQNT